MTVLVDDGHGFAGLLSPGALLALQTLIGLSDSGAHADLQQL